MDGTTRIPLTFPTGSFAVADVDTQAAEATMPLLSGGGTMLVSEARATGGSQRIPVLSGHGDLAGDWITADELRDWMAPDEGGDEDPPADEFAPTILMGEGQVESWAYDVYDNAGSAVVVGAARYGEDGQFGYFWLVDTENGDINSQGPLGPQDDVALASEAWCSNATGTIGWFTAIEGGKFGWYNGTNGDNVVLPTVEGGIDYEPKFVSADSSVIVGKYYNDDVDRSRGIMWAWVDTEYVAIPIDLPEGFDTDINYAAIKVSSEDGTIMVLGLQVGLPSYMTSEGGGAEIDMPEGYLFSALTNMSDDGTVLIGFGSSDGVAIDGIVRIAGEWTTILRPEEAPTGIPFETTENGDVFLLFDQAEDTFGMGSFDPDKVKAMPMPENSHVTQIGGVHSANLAVGTISVEELNRAVIWLVPPGPT